MTAKFSTAADDDAATMLSLGVLAYTLETMIHEGLGHGGLCLAQGHHITLLTPLWMRCDMVMPLMVFAGPMANLVAAILSFAFLRANWAIGDRLRMFGGLSLIFNGLVVTGYPIVGGMTGFGDWPYLFLSIQPAWVWRAGLVVAGLCGYLLALKVGTNSYVASIGGTRRTFVRRVVLSATGAGIVALAAQAYGQGTALIGLVLPAACTFGTGASILLLRDRISGSGDGKNVIARSWVTIALGVFVAAIYIMLIGPGIRIGGAV